VTERHPSGSATPPPESVPEPSDVVPPDVYTPSVASPSVSPSASPGEMPPPAVYVPPGAASRPGGNPPSGYAGPGQQSPERSAAYAYAAQTAAPHPQVFYAHPAMPPQTGYAYPAAQRMPTPAAAYGSLAGYGPAPVRPSSGLFPGPSRPVYRESHPIAAAPVLAGIGAGLLWLGLFGGLAHGLAAYAWWTIVASVSAWAVALLLTVLGDRGVAVGVAVASGVGLSIAMFFVGARWIDTYDWPLW
jgi:hypothetical protein